MTPGQLAQLVLQSATHVLVAPPDRRYVSHGTPAGDLCEELVVWVGSIRQGATNDRPGRCAVLSDVLVSIQITRCHPTQDSHGNPPPASDLNAHGVELTDEAWGLWLGLIAASDEWELSPGPQWLDAQVSEPSGGYASWTLSFTTRLN